MWASMWVKHHSISISMNPVHTGRMIIHLKVLNALKRLSHYQVERLVAEATGRYEFELAEGAFEKHTPVCIIKPSAIRQYAKADNRLARTDKLDAALIAEHGAIMQSESTGQHEARSCSLVYHSYYSY